MLNERINQQLRNRKLETDISLLMGCDQCCYEREIADKLFPGVPIGCFPDLYKAPSGNMPDQVITL